MLRSHTMQLEAKLAEYTNALGMVECTTTSKTSELELKNMFYKTDFALILGKTPVYNQKFRTKKVPLLSTISFIKFCGYRQKSSMTSIPEILKKFNLLIFINPYILIPSLLHKEVLQRALITD